MFSRTKGCFILDLRGIDEGYEIPGQRMDFRRDGVCVFIFEKGGKENYRG